MEGRQTIALSSSPSGLCHPALIRGLLDLSFASWFCLIDAEFKCSSSYKCIPCIGILSQLLGLPSPKRLFPHRVKHAF